jgi:hypothetical protein
VSDDSLPVEPRDLDVGEYCRQVEAHLARMNAGEIIRITGAGFELVRGWALAGIPLSVVCHAITMKAERHAAGRATRPLRIEFCATDVRAVYDDWRRAVGLRAPAAVTEEADALPAYDRPRASVAKHVQRAIDRLGAAVSRVDLAPAVRDALEAALRDLATLAESSRGARGEARDAIVAQLASLDVRMMEGVRAAVGAGELDRLVRETSADLATYRGRIAPEMWERSVDLGVTRLLRDELGLPTLEMATGRGH